MWDDDTLMTGLGAALTADDVTFEPSAEDLAMLSSMVDAEFVLAADLATALVENTLPEPSGAELAALASLIETKTWKHATPAVAPATAPAKTRVISITSSRRFRQITAGIAAAFMLSSGGVAAAATGAVPVPTSVRESIRSALPMELPRVGPARKYINDINRDRAKNAPPTTERKQPPTSDAPVTSKVPTTRPPAPSTTVAPTGPDRPRSTTTVVPRTTDKPAQTTTTKKPSNSATGPTTTTTTQPPTNTHPTTTHPPSTSNPTTTTSHPPTGTSGGGNTTS